MGPLPAMIVVVAPELVGCVLIYLRSFPAITMSDSIMLIISILGELSDTGLVEFNKRIQKLTTYDLLTKMIDYTILAMMDLPSTLTLPPTITLPPTDSVIITLILGAGTELIQFVLIRQPFFPVSITIESVLMIDTILISTISVALPQFVELGTTISTSEIALIFDTVVVGCSIYRFTPVKGLRCVSGSKLKKEFQSYKRRRVVRLYKENKPCVFQSYKRCRVVRLYKENKPSVVRIDNFAFRLEASTFDVLVLQQGFGSGFVWDKDGHVVTNYHVIRDASRLRVTLADQSTYYAKLVGSNQHNDVAVLRVDAPKEELEKLRPLRVGFSADLLVGQRVYAIGHPFGLEHSFTTGVISGLHRKIKSSVTDHQIEDAIQTDAAINPGNSGGPLLDSSGRLIGINTASSSGVAFSIPVDTVRCIVEQLVKFASDESVEQLGVSGVCVLDAPANDPAGKAGLQQIKHDTYGSTILGNIITSVKEKKLTNGCGFDSILDQCKVGDTMILWMD